MDQRQGQEKRGDQEMEAKLGGSKVLSGEGFRPGRSVREIGIGGDVDLPAAERVRTLARHAHADSVAYQSVAVACLQITQNVLQRERDAADAAISLAQREKLQEMIGSLERTVEALESSLSPKGSKMLSARARATAAEKGEKRNWWFALTEAMETVEKGVDTVSGIVSGQPKGGAARVLSSVIARLLHRHHNELLSEAEQWIG